MQCCQSFAKKSVVENKLPPGKQCCGSMTFWCGSGSGFGSGSCYFRHCLRRQQKVKKKSQYSRNQGFSYCFCLMIEESGSRSGSIPLTNGSGFGSRRPKNIRIRRSGSATLLVSIAYSARDKIKTYVLFVKMCNTVIIVSQCLFKRK